MNNHKPAEIRDFMFEKMPWDEIKDRINEHTVAVFVAGATEQHSIHLPVSSDTIIPYKLAQLALSKISNELDVLLLPPLHFGRSPEEQNFAGTIWLRPETFLNVVRDVMESVIIYGIKRIIILNGHGGNPPLLGEVVRSLRAKHSDVYICSIDELYIEPFIKIKESNIYGHACEMETSLVMQLFPERVRENKIRKPNLNFYSINKPGSTERMGQGKFKLGWRVEDFSDTGSFGDPTKASKEKGGIIADSAVNTLVEMIRDFSKFDRDDVGPVEV